MEEQSLAGMVVERPVALVDGEGGSVQTSRQTSVTCLGRSLHVRGVEGQGGLDLGLKDPKDEFLPTVEQGGVEEVNFLSHRSKISFVLAEQPFLDTIWYREWSASDYSLLKL
jgi:hypothetical protein